MTGYEVCIGHSIRNGNFVQRLEIVIQRDALIDGRVNCRSVHDNCLPFIADILMDGTRCAVRCTEIQLFVHNKGISIKTRSIKCKDHFGAALRRRRRKCVRHRYSASARNNSLTCSLIHHCTDDSVLLPYGKMFVSNRILNDNIFRRVNKLTRTLTINSGSANLRAVDIHSLLGICFIFVDG